MKKLQSIRDCLLLSALRVAPDKLLTFVENGQLTSYRGTDQQNKAFQLQYDAHLVLTDFAGDPIDLFWILIEWLHRECPGAAPDALRFHVDVIDTRQVDVSIKVGLTETVTATVAAGGTWLVPDTDPDALALGLFGPGET